MPAPDHSTPVVCSVERRADGFVQVSCAWNPYRPKGTFTEKEATDLALLIIATLYPSAVVTLSQPQGKLI